MARPTRSHERRRREGAVLVESIVVASALILMFACIGFVHRLAAADLHALQEARFQAFTDALDGCPDRGSSLQSVVSDLTSGGIPLPDAFVPSHSASATSERSVAGLLPGATRSVRHTLRIPCRTVPSREGQQPGSWLFELFQ